MDEAQLQIDAVKWCHFAPITTRHDELRTKDEPITMPIPRGLPEQETQL